MEASPSNAAERTLTLTQNYAQHTKLLYMLTYESVFAFATDKLQLSASKVVGRYVVQRHAILRKHSMYFERKKLQQPLW